MPMHAQPLLTASRRRARSWTVRGLLAAYTVFVLCVTMAPDLQDYGVDGTAARILTVLHGLGVPLAFGFAELEFTANIGMFVPLGMLLALSLPRRRVWWGLALLPAFSAAIEIAQGLFLPDRVADVRDVVSNGLGGAIGLLIAVGVRAAVRRRVRR